MGRESLRGCFASVRRELLSYGGTASLGLFEGLSCLSFAMAPDLNQRDWLLARFEVKSAIWTPAGDQ